MTTGRFSCIAMTVLLSACGTLAAAEKPRTTATAQIKDSKGQNVGQAKLRVTRGGVEISATVMNLSPGIHAIHIHEVGKCDAPDFKTAGGHFNPAHKQHGTLNPEGQPAGDLPNLTVGENGRGTFKTLITDVTLAGTDANSLFHAGGTSVVVHEKEDDMKTDPAGNAGTRIACGVIQ